MMKRLRLVFSLTALLVCLVLSSVSVLADEAVDINDLYGTAQTGHNRRQHCQLKTRKLLQVAK